MKAIILMFDSLRRDMLSCYGGDVKLPSFERLAAHTVQYEHCYAGSLPCMPARREIHTGRYNFLHRSWGPLEPFDASMPEILKNNGIYTHLTTDHYHYLQDGGATYHSRYNTWECHRGQESDAWAADMTVYETEFAPTQLSPQQTQGRAGEMRKAGGWQNYKNRKRIHKEEDYPMVRTFQNGITFLRENYQHDNWMLQIETFDPHEPFDSPEECQAHFLSPDEMNTPDWPPYAQVSETPEAVALMRKKYEAMLVFCDKQLGILLNEMDRLDLWKDTLLIVNTDHGFFLSEHGWWGKGSMPNYEELVHTPFFMWNPRTREHNTKSGRLVQTIDIAPTLLDYFHVEIPSSMRGESLLSEVTKAGDRYILFGYHSGPVGITDGRYVLLHAVADASVQTYEYTLMPTHMKTFFTKEELMGAELVGGDGFSGNVPVLKIPDNVNQRFVSSIPFGENLLYDLQTDPSQESPIRNEALTGKLLTEMKRILKENDAPQEVYKYYKL